MNPKQKYGYYEDTSYSINFVGRIEYSRLQVGDIIRAHSGAIDEYKLVEICPEGYKWRPLSYQRTDPNFKSIADMTNYIEGFIYLGRDLW